MIDSKEIDNAIGAHGAWKARLKTAVDTGQLEVPVATISTDNQCAFGKWLYGSTLTSEDKSSTQYAEIKRLHAEFHKAAAQVAQLAMSGGKAEARKMMDQSGAYSAISGKLSMALMNWKKVLQTVAR